MKKLFTDKKWKPWTPCFIITAVGIIFYIAVVATHGFNFMTLNQFFWTCAAVYLVPIFGLVLHRHFSPAITYSIAVIIFFALFCERLFDFYDWLPGYDKIMHTAFGVVGGAIFFTLLLRWTGGKVEPLPMMLLVIIGTLGMGAIWELFEYVTDFVSNDDPQHWRWAVQAIIDAGGDITAANAIQDTMEDLIVTVIGSIGFCIAYIIDLWVDKGKFFLRIFGEGDINSDPLPLENTVKESVEPMSVAEASTVSDVSTGDEMAVAEKTAEPCPVLEESEKLEKSADMTGPGEDEEHEDLDEK